MPDAQNRAFIDLPFDDGDQHHIPVIDDLYEREVYVKVVASGGVELLLTHDEISALGGLMAQRRLGLPDAD